MRQFMSFYRWGLYMKQHMALYTLALIFFKGITQWAMGGRSIEILTLLQMLLVSLAVALLESLIFPTDREFPRRALAGRTVAWALLCNLGFLGGALLFDWFAGIPVWAGVLLVVFLEAGLFAMWVGLHVALRRDTKRLNDSLRRYQDSQA